MATPEYRSPVYIAKPDLHGLSSKKINDIYGYRTRRAMQSQQSWDYANKLSTNFMLLVGASTCLIQFVLQRYFTDETVILAASAWLVIGLLLTIPCTEFYLKKKFGNPN